MEEKGLYFMQMDQNMSANLEMVISTAEVKFLDLMDNISMKSNELISYWFTEETSSAQEKSTLIYQDMAKGLNFLIKYRPKTKKIIM